MQQFVTTITQQLPKNIPFLFKSMSESEKTKIAYANAELIKQTSRIIKQSLENLNLNKFSNTTFAYIHADSNTGEFHNPDANYYDVGKMLCVQNIFIAKQSSTHTRQTVHTSNDNDYPITVSTTENKDSWFLYPCSNDLEYNSIAVLIRTESILNGWNIGRSDMTEFRDPNTIRSFVKQKIGCIKNSIGKMAAWLWLWNYCNEYRFKIMNTYEFYQLE